VETSNHSKKTDLTRSGFLNGVAPKSLKSRKNSKFNKMKTNKILLGGITGGVVGWVMGIGKK